MTTQISLSFELLSLINWLLKNERVMLNSLVKHAIQKGFVQELVKVDKTNQEEIAEQLYTTLLDFLEYLEDTLLKNIETIHLDNKTKDAILPALQKIETDSLDFKTVWLSMQQTTARVNKSQTKIPTNHIVTADAANILFEELLKNWKPNNKETVN